MRVRTLTDAARFVDRAGIAYVFPDNKVPLPTLWGAVQGNPMRPMDPDEWDWTGPVARTWDLKDALGAKRRAWFGRFVRGKGTLISLDVLPALFRLVGTADAGDVSAEGRGVVERLRSVGPMSTLHLRMSLRLSGPKGGARFGKIMLELYRSLMIANVGVDDTETRWPSAVIGLFEKCYPAALRAAAKLSEEDAFRKLVSKAPPLKPRALESLFGLPRLSAFATMPRG